MQIVTAGSAFLDIDAYGGCIAYAELLNKLGKEAKAVSTAPLNESVTQSIRSWGSPPDADFRPGPEDTFTLVDVSDPDFFDKIVNHNHIVEVIDHHPSPVSKWEHLGEGAKIEFIGAACTLVYEHWVKAEKLDEISATSARLLATGILDNTLNFKAKVTTDRDRKAYEDLMKHADLPADWPAQYFNECQESIEANIESAVRNDAKMMPYTEHLPYAFGQLVIWNAQKLLSDERPQIVELMEIMDTDWAVNVVSIGEGSSYFLADNPETQAKIGSLMDVQFVDGVAKADRLWLRKEIMQQAYGKKRSGLL